MPSWGLSWPHVSVLHSVLFWDMSLYVVMWPVFQNVFSDSCLIGTLLPIKQGALPVAQHCGEEIVKLLNTADWPVVLWICPSPFLYITMITICFHALGVTEFCLMIKLKSSCIRVIVFSSASLISSTLIPLLSADFPFFRDCRQFFFG